jgi:hypothetical protein
MPASDLALNIAVGAASSSAAGCITNPIDVIKTEMQLSVRSTVVGTIRERVSRLGVLSLWSGISAMVMRSLFYAGIRLGAYGPIKQALSARDQRQKTAFWHKGAAGTLSGALGAAAANPVEICKTRMQADPVRYSSALSTLSQLTRNEGLAGLAHGLGPHVLRGAAVTASQVGVYDEVKQRLVLHGGLSEGVGLRFSAAMVAGVVTATVSSPFDVLKTRLMTRGGTLLTASRGVWKEAGFAGFFKGWVPQYARLGPHTVIVFMVYERLRAAAGLGML